jgi:hypothetical protein
MDEPKEIILKPCYECGGERILTKFSAEEGILIARYTQSGFNLPEDRHDVAAMVCSECGLLTLYVDDVDRLIRRLAEQ